MNVELTKIAEQKLEQMGATVHGVLVTNEAGAWAAVSEAGRVMWLDGFEGQASSAEPCRFHDDDKEACETYSGEVPCEPEQPSAGVVPCNYCGARGTVTTEGGCSLACPVCLGSGKDKRPSCHSAGVVPENRREFWQKLDAFVDEFIEGYEFRGDDGDYTPSDRERFLIEDCVSGLLHDMDEEGLLTAAPTAPAVQGGGVPDYVWEALQRLIENGGQLGSASREDALVVAKHRYALLTHPHNGEQDEPYPDCDTCGKAMDYMPWHYSKGDERHLHACDQCWPKVNPSAGVVPEVGAMADILGEELRRTQAVYLTQVTLVDMIRKMLTAAPAVQGGGVPELKRVDPHDPGMGFERATVYVDKCHPHNGEQGGERCSWWKDAEDWDGNNWESDCGAYWTFIDEGPVQNEMHYCPKCGRKLSQLPQPPKSKEGE